MTLVLNIVNGPGFGIRLEGKSFHFNVHVDVFFDVELAHFLVINAVKPSMTKRSAAQLNASN